MDGRSVRSSLHFDLIDDSVSFTFIVPGRPRSPIPATESPVKLAAADALCHSEESGECHILRDASHNLTYVNQIRERFFFRDGGYKVIDEGLATMLQNYTLRQ